MSRWFLFVLLCLPTVSHAGAVTHFGTGDPIKIVLIEMQYLHQVGQEIQARYPDAEDPLAMAQCKSQFGYIGTRARGLIGAAGQVDEPHRERVINAGWFANDCIRCGGAVESCQRLPEEMDFLKAIIFEQAESPVPLVTD